MLSLLALHIKGPTAGRAFYMARSEGLEPSTWNVDGRKHPVDVFVVTSEASRLKQYELDASAKIR